MSFENVKGKVTLYRRADAEIIEKKSKFIAHIFYVETPEEADKYIKEITPQKYLSKIEETFLNKIKHF